MKTDEPIVKLPTYIPGLDHLTQGGIPIGRTTLVTGTAGSSKTVFASQFLAGGIEHADEPGVFITFEESVEDLRRNMMLFGWDINRWEAEGKWAFVDASPDPSYDQLIVGDYDLGALIARIENAVKKIGAVRLSIDSLGAIFTQFTDSAKVRRELFKIASVVKRLGVTSVMTAERTSEYGEIARYGVEEFVADNVIILRNVLEEEKRRRTIEVLKFRGTNHHKGEYPFTIIRDQGIVVIPLSAIELKQESSDTRITSGSENLDRMCGGGFFRDSIILVSGATGTGKTLMATEFLAGGVEMGERCLLFAFEESRQQLFRNASGWGVDFPSMEKEGKLMVKCQYPESSGLEDHLIQMKNAIKEFKPNRVAVDSLSALERVSSAKGFREFVISLTSFIKQQEIAGFFAATTDNLLGGACISDAHISTITDSIILLRYVEIYGEMRRGLTVLKMRGSMHEKEIREFSIDQNGMHIGKPFREVAGILVGRPRQAAGSELNHIRNLFVQD